MPDYAETEFIRLPMGDPTHSGGAVPALAWIWPIDHPERPLWVESSQRLEPNVHGEAVSVGTRVLGRDGVEAGVVTGLVLDTEQTITHLILRIGVDKRTPVPIQWVTSIDADLIHIAVAASDLGQIGADPDG
ncbi:MAG: PRC-barrel domain-containing protein [Deltaproteobacteria bacterium]|nr:PRC-barrel domain-containing protein [Deltaproteobacteria bacterium]